MIGKWLRKTERGKRLADGVVSSRFWRRADAAITVNRASLFTFEMLRTFVEAGIMAWVIYLFFFQLSLVEGSSMEPNFHTGDRVFVNKFLYKWISPPKRGDIVVHRFPLDPSQDFIKRIVAVPGDSWEISEGELYVNDIKIKEPYIKEIMRMDHEMAHLTEGQYLTMGDNRNNSSDGRAWGPVDFDLIKGKVIFRFWPVNAWSLTPAYRYPEWEEEDK